MFMCAHSTGYAAASCDSASMKPLTDALTKCIQASPMAPGSCACEKTFEEGTAALGCPPATQAGIVAGCAKIPGCTVELCGGPIVDNCNSTVMQSCADGVSTCMRSGGAGSLCNCEGAFVKCYESHGCGATMVNAAKQGCMSAGCTATQCSPTMTRELWEMIRH